MSLLLKNRLYEHLALLENSLLDLVMSLFGSDIDHDVLFDNGKILFERVSLSQSENFSSMNKSAREDHATLAFYYLATAKAHVENKNFPVALDCIIHATYNLGGAAAGYYGKERLKKARSKRARQGGVVKNQVTNVIKEAFQQYYVEHKHELPKNNDAAAETMVLMKGC